LRYRLNPAGRSLSLLYLKNNVIKGLNETDLFIEIESATQHALCNQDCRSDPNVQDSPLKRLHMDSITAYAHMSSHSIATPNAYTHPLQPYLPISKRRINSSKTLTPTHSHIHLTLLINHQLIVLQDLSAHTVPRGFAAGHKLKLRDSLFGDELEAVNCNPCLPGGLTEAADLL
jgi:hypothetical protein